MNSSNFVFNILGTEEFALIRDYMLKCIFCRNSYAKHNANARLERIAVLET